MTLITSIITAALMTASLSNVTTQSGENHSKIEIQREITEQLSVPDFYQEEDRSHVTVRFRISEESKMDVLNVRASHKKLANYVENELEGSTLDVSHYKVGASYVIPIRFQKL